MKKKLTSLALVTALSCSSAAYALDLQAIQQKAAKINEAKGLLNNPDPTVRLAVIEAMIESDDLAMRELGYQAGFANDDDAVRAITLRKRFKELKNLRLELELPEKATEPQQKMFANPNYSGAYIVNVYKYDETTGQFFTNSGNTSPSYTATLNGIYLTGSNGSTNFKLKLNDESVFEGSISQTNQSGWTLPAKLVIQ